MIDRLPAIKAACRALREGVGTREQWLTVATAVQRAKDIEREGRVRGMVEYLQSADTALRAIYTRADQLLGWCPVPLEFDELDALQTFVDLHALQMRQLSRATAPITRRATMPTNLRSFHA
jgi:hypothetical protein